MPPIPDEDLVDLFLTLRECLDRHGSPRHKLVLQCPTPGGFIDLYTISEGASLTALHSLLRTGLIRLVQAARSQTAPECPAQPPCARPRTAFDRLRDPDDPVTAATP